MGAISKIILLILVFAGIGGVYAYTSLVQPLSKMQIQPGEVEPVSLEPLVLQLSVDIVNPGKPVKLPGASINLYLNDARVGTGTLPGAVIGEGSTTLHAEITLDKSAAEFASLAVGQPGVSIDGTLFFKVLSFNVKVPIPKVPVPGGLDIAAFAGGDTSGLPEILGLLSENPGLKLGEALSSGEFLAKFKEKTGTELTVAKIQELKQLLGEGAMNKTADELLKDPSILQKLQ
jgi:LEA14-like dessication related protein